MVSLAYYFWPLIHHDIQYWISKIRRYAGAGVTCPIFSVHFLHEIVKTYGHESFGFCSKSFFTMKCKNVNQETIEPIFQRSIGYNSEYCVEQASQFKSGAPMRSSEVRLHIWTLFSESKTLVPACGDWIHFETFVSTSSHLSSHSDDLTRYWGQ